MLKKLILSFCVLFLLVSPSFGEEINLKSSGNKEAVTLQNLIQEAITKNPILLSLGHQITAQTAKASWIKVRPDPFFTNSTNTDKYPFRYSSLGEDPVNQVQFQLGQEFPFPGKLKLKGRVESSELEKVRSDYNLAKLEIISRLKKAYYDLSFATKSLEITQEIKKLLETLASTVKAKYEVGGGTQQDLLKIHLEISKLLDSIETLKKDRESYIAEINSIVIRPQGTDITELEEVTKEDVSYKLAELIELAKEKYPLLLGQKSLIQKSEYGIKLAKKEYFPNYSIEGGYGLRSRPFDPMYTIQVMTSLPVYYRSKQRKQVEEATAALKAQEEIYHEQIIEAEKRVKDLHIQIEKNETLIDLLQTGLIPQARLTVDSSVAAYKVDKTDFLNLLDNIRTLLEFQIKYYERLTNYQKAIAELEPLIGRETW